MSRAVAGVLSILFFLGSLVFIGRVGPSELPTIEQVLPADALEGLALERRYFGGELDVALVVLRREDGGALAISDVRTVEERLRRIDGVARTWSARSVADEIRRATGGGISTSPETHELAPSVETAPGADSSFFSPDSRTSWIALRLDDASSRLSRARAITREIDAVLESAAPSGVRAFAIGNPWLRVASWEAASHDLERMLPWLVGVVVVVPLVLFGSLESVVLPLFLAALSVAVTLSLYRFLVGTLDALVLLLVPLIWSIATLDAIHLQSVARRLHSPRGGRSRDRTREARLEPECPLRGAISELAWPCLLTSLTTFAGLVALAIQDDSRLLRAFGVWGALGTAIAYGLTFALGPLLFGILPRGRRAPRWPGRVASRLAAKSLRHRIATLSCWSVLTAVAVWFALDVHLATRFPRIFVDGHPVARKLEMVSDALGTEVAPIDIVIQATDDAGRAPEALVAAAIATSTWARRIPETRFVLPADLLNLQGLEALRPQSRDPRELTASLEKLGEEKWIAPWLDRSHGAGRIQIHSRAMTDARRAEVIEWLDHFDETMLSHHRLVPSGPGYYYALVEWRGVRGAAVGALISLLAVGGILLAWLRNARTFLAAIVANIVPAVIVAGIVGCAEIPWSLALLPAPALLLGLGVDDTIHVLWRKGRAREARRGRQILLAARRAGPALIATTFVLAGSAATLSLSALTVNRDLGLVLPLGFLVALAADLTLLPALAATAGVKESRRR